MMCVTFQALSAVLVSAILKFKTWSACLRSPKFILQWFRTILTPSTKIVWLENSAKETIFSTWDTGTKWDVKCIQYDHHSKKISSHNTRVVGKKNGCFGVLRHFLALITDLRIFVDNPQEIGWEFLVRDYNLQVSFLCERLKLKPRKRYSCKLVKILVKAEIFIIYSELRNHYKFFTWLLRSGRRLNWKW